MFPAPPGSPRPSRGPGARLVILNLLLLVIIVMVTTSCALRHLVLHSPAAAQEPGRPGGVADEDEVVVDHDPSEARPRDAAPDQPQSVTSIIINDNYYYYFYYY